MPTLLDLFCGAGGAGEGYSRAGFDVTGVDIRPQKNHPAHMRFIQADALAYALQYGWMYDVIHASPPCQAHSTITPDKSKHVDLIPQTRFVLETLGKPYVIENVAGARKALRDAIMLCGAQFGLKVYRHRYFESNVYLMAMPHAPHRDNTPRAGHGVSDKGFISPTSGGMTSKPTRRASGARHTGTRGMTDNGFVVVSGNYSGLDYCKRAMGIDWMTQRELTQAIPPAFTHFIGAQLMTYLRNQSPSAIDEFSIWEMAV